MKLILLLSLFISLSAQAFNRNHIGRVVKLRGTVSATNKLSGEQRQIYQGDKLYQGDELNSQAGSFAKILMLDDTIFNVGPKSKFIFEKFVFHSKKKRVATYNLVRGKLRSLFTVKSPEKTLKIKTPTASMGIRGTEIVSDVYKVNGSVQTDIALISGKLEISSDVKGKLITHWITPGQIYQMGKSIGGERSLASAINPVKNLPKAVFRRLKMKANRGGETFLFDASKGDSPAKKVDWSFDEKVDDKRELRSDDEAKVDHILNDENKKMDMVKKIEKFDQKMKSAGIKVDSSDYNKVLFEKNSALFELKKKLKGEMSPGRGPASVSLENNLSIDAKRVQEKAVKAASESGHSPGNFASHETRQKVIRKAGKLASKETQLQIQRKMERHRRLLEERRRRLELERLRLLRERELASQIDGTTQTTTTTTTTGGTLSAP